MAAVSQSSSTKTSVTLYVSGLSTTSNYDVVTITCNGVTSGNLAKGGTGQSTSNSVTFGSLTCGSSYPASCSVHTTAGSSGSGSGTGTTLACAPTPGSIASVSLNATGTTTMSASWGSSTNASTYSYELWRSGGSVVASNYSYGSTSQSFTGLTPSTAYYLKVWGRNVDGIAGPPTNSSTVSTLSNTAPTQPSNSINTINGKTITINTNYSSNTTSIDYDYYWIEGYPNATISVSGTSTTHTFTVPEYSTEYKLDCLAKNSVGGSPWSTSLTFTSGPAPVPPSTPTNFRFVSATTNSMVVAWDSVTGATYNIEAYNKGTTTNPVFTSYSYASTSITITGLASNTEYDIKLYSNSANGNSSPTWLYGQRTAIPQPPSPPSNFRITGSGHTTLMVAWDNVSGATYNLEVYLTGTTTNPVYTSYSIPNATLSATASGLNSFTSYDLKLYSNNVNGSSTPTWLYNRATSGPAPSIPSLTYISTVGRDITIRINHGNNIASIEMDYYWISSYPDFTVPVVMGTTSTLHTFTVPANNTTYQCDARAKNPVGTSGWSSSVSFSSGPLTPPNLRIVSKTGTTMLIAWDSVASAVYNIEVYNKGTTTNPIFKNYSMAGTSVNATGLTSYTEYDVKLYASNAGNQSTPSWLYNVRTADTIAPVIEITGMTGLGTMNVQYSASDVGSGLRSPSRYAVHIGTQNGGAGTTVHKAYTDDAFYTFTTDADGLPFVHNSAYWIKVYAYDVEGNSTGTSVQITYTSARPTNWAWHTAKVSGQPVTLTATEWNSFCTKINQFRAYKNLTAYSFTTAIQGNPITATIFNQGRSAILEMNPSIALPTSKTSKVSSFRASDFNGLRDSLNSIT